MSNQSFGNSKEFAELDKFKLTISRLYNYFDEIEFHQVYHNISPITSFKEATTPCQLGYIGIFICNEINTPMNYNIFNCSRFYEVVNLIKPDFEQLEEKYKIERQETFLQMSKLARSFIYKISNVITGQCYIGKTCKKPTNRWYQHFSKPGNSKFHQAIKNSPITEWTFTVIEEIEFPIDVYLDSQAIIYIKERENYWIKEYDAINSGYNSNNVTI